MFQSSWTRSLTSWLSGSRSSQGARRRPARKTRSRPRLEALEDRCLLSAGDIDPGFNVTTTPGQRGVIRFNNAPSGDDRAHAVAVQADGKVVLAGYRQFDNGGDFDFALVRLNADGSLDSSFGSGGRATVAFDLGGSRDDRANAVAIAPDGKIVVAGYAQSSSTGFDIAVARLSTNGSPDSSFGPGGKRTFTFDVSETRDSRANGVVVQPDGKIVVAGYLHSAGDSNFAFLRLNTDGTLDSTFGTGGKAEVSVSTTTLGEDRATSVALQTDGKIVAAGYARRVSQGFDMALVRLNANGSLDSGFDSDGEVFITFDLRSQGNDRANSVAIAPDGKIVVAGFAENITAGDLGLAVARLNSNGSLDTTFGSGGKFTLNRSGEDAATGVVVQRDGKPVVAGYTDSSTFDEQRALRLTTTGILDPTFRERTFASGSWENERFTGVALQSDGNLVFGGFVKQPSTTNDHDFYVLQLHNDPWIVVAPDAGGPPLVRMYSPTGVLYREFFAYGASFTGGVRVAMADINSDGVKDIFTSPGPGGQPFVNVFDGRTFSVIRQFLVYGITFTGGVNLAVDNVMGQSGVQLIVAPDAGGDPFVNIFETTNGQLVQQIQVYGTGFKGGVRIATADVDNNFVPDLLVAPQAGGAPFVNIFNAQTRQLINQLQVYGSSFTGGLFITTGDVNSDGQRDLIVGPDQGGEPYVNAFTIATRQLVRQYLVYGTTFTAGVRVAAIDVTGDGTTDIVAGPGRTGEPYVKIVDADTRATAGLFLAYTNTMTSGLFILATVR